MITLAKNIAGKQKAAILLITLGSELSAKVFRYLRESEIETLAREIAMTRRVPPELRDEVLAEFRELCLAKKYIEQGGLEYAKDVLEKAVGLQKAMEIIHKLMDMIQIRPFEFVRKADPGELINFLQDEHPQTIALILSYLDYDKAAAVLSSLPPEVQVEVAKRVATMDRTSPSVIAEVEKVLQRKMSSLVDREYTAPGGLTAIVGMLNKVDRSTEKRIIESLEAEDPELAEEIKKRMFMFEDIVLLDDRAVQRVLREVDIERDLPVALKGASEEVKNKIMKNLSTRAQENLKENMSYLGPVRLKQVEEVQQKIVSIIRRLEAEGEIVISRGGGDEVIV